MLGGLFNDVSQQVVSLYPLRTIFGLRQVNFNGEYKRISVDATNLAFDDVVQHVMFLFPALRGKPFSVRYQDEEGAFPRLFFDHSLGHRASILPRVSSHHGTIFCSTAALLSERPPFRSTINPH